MKERISALMRGSDLAQRERAQNIPEASTRPDLIDFLFGLRAAMEPPSGTVEKQQIGAI